MMEYYEKDFVLEEIESKVKTINNMFDLVNKSVSTYKTKYASINEKMEMLNHKTNLNLDNTTTLMKFQNQLILNEIKYLNSLKQVIYTRFVNELFKLSEKLTFVCISIINLNKDINQDHIHQVKKAEKTSSIDDFINTITENFENIKVLLLGLKQYNENINNEMTSGNFHCGTLNIDLMTKRVHIFLEYKKIVNYFYTILNYFFEMSESINNNLDNTSIFNFLVSQENNTMSRNKTKDNLDDMWSINSDDDIDVDLP